MTCGKVIHLTKESAEGHAARLKELTGVLPLTYQCEECADMWHVGHSPALRQKLSKKSRRLRNSRRNGGRRKGSCKNGGYHKGNVKKGVRYESDQPGADWPYS